MEGRALGKGLSALIPDKVSLEGDGGFKGQVAYIKTASVRDNAFQPRVNYDESKLAELIASIKEKGVLQPILVREVSGGYEVVAGERRLKAARALALDEVPAIVKQVSDQEALVIALVENIQREELNSIEEAHAFKRLIEEFKYTQDTVAQSVGKDRSTISNTMRLLNLPDEIQDALISNKISMGHARTLLSVDDAHEQRKLFDKAVQKGLSVRELENLTKGFSSTSQQRAKLKAKEKNHEIVYLEEDLQQVLGTKVRIQAQKKRGKIIIEYYSPADLDRVLQIIKR